MKYYLFNLNTYRTTDRDPITYCHNINVAYTILHSQKLLHKNNDVPANIRFLIKMKLLKILHTIRQYTYVYVIKFL